MANATAVGGLQFLTQSPVRVRVLELLYESGRLRKRELRDRVDASRVTVRRNVHALEDRDWIEIDGREFEITVLGTIIVEDVSPAFETMAVVERLRPFLCWFPESELEFDVRELADATIVVSDSVDPYAPVNRHIEAMDRSERYRGLLPAVGLQAMTTARDCLVEGDSRHEVVVCSRLEPILRDRPTYRDLVDEMLETGRCEVAVSDRQIPFYLGIFDDRVQIGVGDDEGVPKALVETEACEIREWAEQTYERYQAGSTPFDG